MALALEFRVKGWLGSRCEERVSSPRLSLSFWGLDTRPSPPFNLKSICASFPPDGSGINLFPCVQDAIKSTSSYARDRSAYNNPSLIKHRVTTCGNSYETSTEGCPLCGWGEARRQLSTKPTSWFSILASGLNLRFVSISAASMLTLLIEVNIVLAVAGTLILLATNSVPLLLLICLVGTIYWAHSFCQKYFGD
jgi:hypothetical protein